MRVCVNIGSHCGLRDSDLYWRGIAGAVIADVARAAGVNVEVSACFYLEGATHCRRGSLFTEFVVSDSRTPASVTDIAYQCGSMDMFRVLSFQSVTASMPALLADGMGRPESVPVAEVARYDVLIPHDCTTRQGAIAEVLKAIRGMMGA
jgi:hypothetical protein